MAGRGSRDADLANKGSSRTTRETSMTVVVGHRVAASLARAAQEISAALRLLLMEQKSVSSELAEAMRYSIEAGGKRLRPALVLWCCDLCGGRRELAMPAALAVECVHTFSLIHDDLPALDNDDFRRGRPSCHKRFGEATAILAGDALLALGFQCLTAEVLPPRLAVLMTRELAEAVGPRGLIGGEAADLQGERLPANTRLVEAIHEAKTARLIETSCRLGGLAADADESRMSALSAYGRALGLAFQAADDLLDLTSSCEKLGKAAGKDQRAGKQTFVRAVGMESARRIATERAEEAIAAIAPLGEATDPLVDLARYVVERDA